MGLADSIEAQNQTEIEILQAENKKQKRALDKMFRVKDASDGKVALVSCQGQAMDGYSELANYRQILEQYRGKQNG